MTASYPDSVPVGSVAPAVAAANVVVAAVRRGGEEMDRRVLTPRQRGGFDSCAVVGQGYAGDQESHGLRSQPSPFCDAVVEFPGLVAELDAVDVEGAALEGAHGDVEGSRVPVS